MKILERQRKNLFPYLLLIPVLALLISIVVYPLIYSLSLSFCAYDLKKPWLGKQFIGVSNYVNIFKDSLFATSLKVTGFFLLGAIPIEFFLGLGIALLLNKDVKGSKVVRTLVVIPMMLTPIIVGLQWRFMFNYDCGLVNYLIRGLHLGSGIAVLSNRSLALFGVILADVWQWTPFIVLLCYSGLRALPVEPYEAARIDGASGWQTFKYLTIPLIKPVVLIAVLLRTMDAFRIYDVIYTMTYGGPGVATEVASFYVYRKSFKFLHMGYGSALSYILLIISIILATMFVKMLKKSWQQ